MLIQYVNGTIIFASKHAAIQLHHPWISFENNKLTCFFDGRLAIGINNEIGIGFQVFGFGFSLIFRNFFWSNNTGN